jgi:hypothetical protein
MNGPGVEVGDVIGQHGADFLERYGPRLGWVERRVLVALAACRTASLGGHLEACDACGFERPAYNSCRNRYCPKCQGTARAAWLAAQAEDLLPVPYFHVVFTLPDALGPLALANQRLVYGLLFHAASATLLEVAADPKHLGARIGFLTVLHTWGQTLQHHPHVHCVVPGGGLAPDGTRWVPARKRFFLPVRVLSRVFRGKFLAGLKAAHEAGELACGGALAELANPVAFRRWLRDPAKKEWVVYAKPPFGRPEVVLKYLARYTHRVAIANSRLVALVDGRASFRYKDYRDGNRWKTMTLSAVEFIRRFLQHVLPVGFVRIRHYGFLANRARQQWLPLCRQLLGVADPATNQPVVGEGEAEEETEVPVEARVHTCPECHAGRMVAIRLLPLLALQPVWRTTPALNTS